MRSSGADGVTELMKRLREAPTKSGSPKRLNSASRAMQADALFRRLAEADAGIEHDAVAGDAGALGDLQRASKERLDIGDDVDGRVGRLAVMHDDDRHAVFGDDRGHGGIALQAPDVVDDGGALVERPGGDLGLDGVDRHRQPSLTTAGSTGSSRASSSS